MAEAFRRWPAGQAGWLAAGVVLVAFIVWGSLTPSPPDISPPIPQFDKLEHFGAYVLMTGWFVAAFARRALWVALVFVVLGGAVEILQGYTGRDPEWFDWIADCIGVAVGTWYPARWLTALRARLLDRHAQPHA